MAAKKDKDQENVQATTSTTEAAEKEAQAILEAAKAEAARIVAEAQVEAGKTAEATKAQDKPNGQKMVTVHLFKDSDKYKDDVFVAVNGRSYQIQRGKDVQVPDYVAEVLERSMKQDQATAGLIARKSDEFATEAAARNI